MFIQKMHQYLSNSFAIVPLCLLIFLVSTSAKTHPPIAKAEYSGEDLFRGIFFAQGSIAQKVSALEAFDINQFIKDAPQKKELVNFHNRVMATISKDHGPFLKELKAAVASNNKFKIRKVLLRGNEILVDVSTMLSDNERDLKKEKAIQNGLAQK